MNPDDLTDDVVRDRRDENLRCGNTISGNGGPEFAAAAFATDAAICDALLDTRAEIERLRAIAERWEPRYADGAPIDDPKDVVVFAVVKNKVYEDRGALEWHHGGGWSVAWGGPYYDWVSLAWCYSTREAAEAAAGEVQP